MCPGENNEWFHTWFDSPYYHALYQNRDNVEAAGFLTQLLDRLALPDDARLLDLACGRGRHSIFLNSRGYHVTGVDLSRKSIASASRHANDRLHFLVQDMRELSIGHSFDCILNLFTSFGYFTDEEDNVLVLKRVKQHLKPGGIFVLDYFNADLVCRHIHDIEKDLCGVHFSMKKRVQDGRILKDIQVTDGEKKFHFTEQVQLLNATMLHAMLLKAGLTPVSEFGNYSLQPYEAGSSERLIIIAHNQ